MTEISTDSHQDQACDELNRVVFDVVEKCLDELFNWRHGLVLFEIIATE